ncbi:Zn-dependent hydrolase [Verrucomicrobia bacterium LW23]|nr:Zn-dependent hydrolase [Verrucomicrobia bacterium LW23]
MSTPDPQTQQSAPSPAPATTAPHPEMRTAGMLHTNFLLVRAPGGWVMFDAPDGSAEMIRGLGIRLAALVLTHGHFDHIWDAARLADDHDCPVHAHDADAPMMRQPALFSRFFPPAAGIRPVPQWQPIALPDRGAADWSVAGAAFRAFHIPGHSAGSVAFYMRPEAGGAPGARPGYVIGGDVLFNGGLGRWDFPGGSLAVLRRGIYTHLLPLPQDTVVYPGHGPATTTGHEARGNPYLRDDFDEDDELS